MTIEHKNITDPDIHLPKGFSTASVLQYPRKNAAGTDIEWVDITKAYGCMYATSGTTTGVDGSWKAINNAVLGGTVVWTTQTTSNITNNTTSGFYQANNAGTYMIGVAFSISGAIATTNEFQFTIGIDSAPSYPGIAEKSSIVTVYRTISSSDKGSVALTCQPTLAVNDRLYLMIKRNSGTNQIVFNHINFVITKVS
jgi:hypothetical protein